MQELKRHGKFDFGLKFIVMDPGYAKQNRQLIEQNLKILGIDAEIFETNIFEAVTTIQDSPCYVCARMRRGYLYKKAQSLGCNKIALGHHFDDVIETTLMSMFYNGKIQTMPPKLISDNYNGMELIRPLYQIHEQDIINWAKFNDLKFINCACKFTEKGNEFDSKRAEIKQVCKELKKLNPIIPHNIFMAVHRCNVDTMVGYEIDREYHDFNTEFERKKDLCLKEKSH